MKRNIKRNRRRLRSKCIRIDKRKESVFIDKFGKKLDTKVVNSKLYHDYKTIISKYENGKVDNSEFFY